MKNDPLKPKQNMILKAIKKSMLCSGIGMALFFRFAPRALNSVVECHLHTVEVTGSNPVARIFEPTPFVQSSRINCSPIFLVRYGNFLERKKLHQTSSSPPGSAFFCL